MEARSPSAKLVVTMHGQAMQRDWGLEKQPVHASRAAREGTRSSGPGIFEAGLQTRPDAKRVDGPIRSSPIWIRHDLMPTQLSFPVSTVPSRSCNAQALSIAGSSMLPADLCGITLLGA